MRCPILLLLLLLAACAAPPELPDAPSPAPSPRPTSPYVLHPLGGSNVEEAHARLEAEGEKVYLIFVSADSPGAEGEIYWDLRTREIRATTGPDEGIDTQALSCYPDCVLVRREDANMLNVTTWEAVLRHEYRHVAQARNNPELAHDFRGADGRFTPYAAFMEACADYGLNVRAAYHAQERMDELLAALGQGWKGLIGQACAGQRGAFPLTVQEYDRRRGGTGAFYALFPPYD